MCTRVHLEQLSIQVSCHLFRSHRGPRGIGGASPPSNGIGWLMGSSPDANGAGFHYGSKPRSYGASTLSGSGGRAKGASPQAGGSGPLVRCQD